MLPDVPTVSQLSQAFLHATAPAFLLGAIAGFVAILNLRLDRILDYSKSLNADDALKESLTQRARLLSYSIYFAILSAVIVALVVIATFIYAIFGMQAWGVGPVFVTALGFFIVSLINFARELKMALAEFKICS